MPKYLGPPQSGSCADLVYSHNRYGQYTRARTTPGNPQSSYQTTIRLAMTAASQQWQTLSQAQRDAWQSYAAEYPTKGSLGTTHKRDGFHAFVSNAINLTLTSGTVSGNLPASRKITYPGTAAFTMNAGSETFDLTWTVAIPTGNFLLCQYSPPRSPGYSFNAQYCLLSMQGTGAVSVNDAGNYVNRYNGWNSGDKVFVRLTPINASGIAGVPLTVAAISS